MSEKGLTSRMPRVRNPLRPQENKPKSCDVGEAQACQLCAYAQVERYKDDTIRSLPLKQGESDESLILQAWANKVAPGWDANDSAETAGVGAQPAAALPETPGCEECAGEGSYSLVDESGNEEEYTCEFCKGSGIEVPSSQAAALVRNVTDAAAAAGVQSPPVEPLGESSVAASGGGLPDVWGEFVGTSTPPAVAAMCSRPTGAECWRLITKYQGVSPHWPKSGCYVVRVTETLVRKPSRRALGRGPR